ncbi:MAG: terminase family protein [Candidatus Puniceispirillum sp.]
MGAPQTTASGGELAGLAELIGLVGDTFDDVRHVMVEGPAGILANSPKWARPDWQPSQRRLIWPNGVTARCFSANDPEQLRGPEFEFVWADEIAKWRHQAAWDNLMLALRIGDAPRALATTTPRPLRWHADLAEADDTALVQGRTVENQPNLSPSYLAAMHARYGRGWLARQELDAVLSLAAPDALFQREMLAAIRRDAPPRRDFVRVVIAADDWQAAAAEALASKWAGPLPRRAAEIARLLRG